MLPLILASSSPYRKMLLAKLGLQCETIAPGIDESPLPMESPDQLVLRLAETKARAATPHTRPALMIGSDQVAVLDGQIIGKPYTMERARHQLRCASGRSVTFLTGLCLYNSASDRAHCHVEPFTVHFRTLSDEQIERYLVQDKPLDCAGSFKSEGLGISLFTKLEGDDPNSLVGLPLIRLVELLEMEGIAVP